MNQQTAARAADTIPDSEIEAKTGKTFKAWVAALDHADMSAMSYEQVAACLGDRYGLGPWWQHILAAKYVHAVTLRDRPNGYEFSVSRPLEASASSIYRVLANTRDRTAWLGDNPVAPRRSIADRAFRAAWLSDNSFIDISLTPRGESRCLVTVQHSKLATPERAAEMKIFWTDTLQRLERIDVTK